MQTRDDEQSGERETIFALSSASGRAGVAVVRVSGPCAFKSLDALLAGATRPLPRKVSLRSLKDPSSGHPIDEALVSRFCAPSSFTGEDCVEYAVHGSPAVVQALLAALSSQPSHRVADPGEFTRRAFENGKLDLTEAEAVGDLIHAQTQAQRLQALAQMGGALSSLYMRWREDLIRSLAYIEATLDFPEEDLPEEAQLAAVLPDLERVVSEIRTHLEDGHKGERVRDGITIAILGAPNAGKSSFLNTLARRDVAIVSPFAGTTRDVIEVHLDLEGFAVTVADTAGLRSTEWGSEPEPFASEGGSPPISSQVAVEAEGVRRARMRAHEADLRLLLFDGTSGIPDQETLALFDPANSFLLCTKADLVPPVARGFDFSSLRSFQDAEKEKGERCASHENVPYFWISTQTGEGVSDFLSVLGSFLRERYTVSRETPLLTRARHREALQTCLSSLEAALHESASELAAESLRLAVRSLGRITGRVDVEDLLDIIFRDFCIGK